jgi:hypothetical protein
VVCGWRATYKISVVHGVPSNILGRIPLPTESYLFLVCHEFYLLSHVQKVDTSSFLMLLRSCL